jgi:hypothetical protein
VLTNKYWAGTAKVQDKNQDGSQEQARFEGRGESSPVEFRSPDMMICHVHIQTVHGHKKMSATLEVNRERKIARFWVCATVITVFDA